MSTDQAPPPWTCRLRAIVRLGIGHGGVTVLAVVAYAETPVGPYGEALLAQVRLPLAVTVPWIVVDSAASVVAGRRHWGLPKQRACLSIDLDGLDAAVQVPGSPGDDLHLRAYAWGLTAPVRGAAALHQPERGPAPLRFRGRARPALVRVTGGPAPGAGPGAVLDGVLWLGAAGQQDR